MLITNFSAGELSETLFGRVDLPQYYSAASRLENFDVIPTGGIKRRGGTEQLKKLDEGDGRIIPFIINRDLGFLLYLTPGKISVYILYKGEITGTPTAWDSDEYTKLYENISEIREVQYAQNFDMMVLCHENYPPLEIKAETNFIAVSIRTFGMNFNTSIISGQNVTEEDSAEYVNDPGEYKPRGWLVTDGNYPSAVCFLHGRLVFAGTKNDRQRIFASAVKQSGQDYNFSTYKIFLTEKRTYSVLFGKIERTDTSIITSDAEYIINSFGRPPEAYYVDSQLYPSDTRIEEISLNRVKLTKGLKNPENVLNIEGIKGDLLAKIDAYDENENGTEYIIYNRSFDLAWSGVPSNTRVKYESEVKCIVKAKSLKVTYNAKQAINNGNWNEMANDTWPKVFNKDAAKELENISSRNASREEIITKINSYISVDKTKWSDKHNVITTYHAETILEQANLKTESINRLFDNILSTMRYEITTSTGVEKFHDIPINLFSIIMARIVNTDKTYIGLYTRDIITDEYPTPDCGFTFEIASDTNDAIKWLAVNKGLIAGTETGEWIIPPGVHATNIQASLNSRYGSDSIQGAAVGDATVFFQAGKKALAEYYIPQQDNNFRANNMALLSPQMLAESPAREFDFISSPHAKLLITREDGAAVTLLYERSTGTFAWGRLTSGADKIRSAAVLPGTDGNDDVYFVVEREKGFFLEKLREDCGVYLDCWKAVNEGSWEAAKAAYGEDAKLSHVFVNKEGKKIYETYALDDSGPFWERGGEWFIGYPYKSVMRTMPVITNDKMKKQRIVELGFRFLDSYLPEMTALTRQRAPVTNVITAVQPPYSGICKQPFPGDWDEEVQAELSTDKAAPVKLLALNAVTMGAQ